MEYVSSPNKHEFKSLLCGANSMLSPIMNTLTASKVAALWNTENQAEWPSLGFYFYDML
jgi:hypothetical protein